MGKKNLTPPYIFVFCIRLEGLKEQIVLSEFYWISLSKSLVNVITNWLKHSKSRADIEFEF